jgi:hypothetical protein
MFLFSHGYYDKKFILKFKYIILTSIVKIIKYYMIILRY